jgi:hypothetical protein
MLLFFDLTAQSEMFTSVVIVALMMEQFVKQKQADPWIPPVLFIGLPIKIDFAELSLAHSLRPCSCR